MNDRCEIPQIAIKTSSHLIDDASKIQNLNISLKHISIRKKSE